MDGLVQELIDQIIDCCNLAEKDAMGACGLVCKLWLPRSRYHLFSRVSVNTDNLHSFVDVLESSSSPILTFIRRLTFEYGILDTDGLHPCPNLGSIDILWGPYKEGTWPDAYTALKTNLRSWNNECSSSLSRLVLTDVEGASPLLPLSMVTEIILCVPGIRTLEIWRIHIVGRTADSPPPASLSRLEDLILVPQGGCTLLFSWLCSLPVPPILRSLEISRFIEDAYDEDEDENMEPLPLAAYFRQAGTGLQTLNINLLSGHLFPEFERQILQYTPNLRYLQFKAFRSSDLLDVLERLPASQEWAAIEARIRLDPTGSDELPWSAKDAALVPLRTLMRFDLFLLASYSRTAHETSAFTPQTRLLMPLANTRRILG